MRYMESDINRIVEEKKRKFKISLGVMLFFVVLSVVLIAVFIGKNNDLVFCLGLFIAFEAFKIYKLIEKSSPAILFSRQVIGENIKEIEYIPNNVRITSGGGRYAFMRAASGGNVNARRHAPRNIHAKLYLKLENGNILEISGLKKRHTDLYEDKDTLLRYAGTKYPVIIDRSVNKQPCPICGEINGSERFQCSKCGIGIEKQDYMRI